MDEVSKLNNLVKRSNRILFEADTVFPLDLFPDTIRIDENKVDIIARQFLSTKHVLTIMIDSINTVTLSTGPIFATLNFEVNGFVTGYEVKPGPIRHLWKRDAVKIRRIVLGLVAARNENIKLEEIPPAALRPKVEQIGKAKEFTHI